MALLDAFIGVPQSKVAAFAILVSLAVVSLAIVLGDITVPPSYRLLTILFMVLMSIPSVLVTLVNITCAVSGAGQDKWWCGVWAWVLTGFVSFYSVLLVIAAMMVMSNKTELKKDSVAQDKIVIANHAAEGFFAEAPELVPAEKEQAVSPPENDLRDFPEGYEDMKLKDAPITPEQEIPEPFEEEVPAYLTL